MKGTKCQKDLVISKKDVQRDSTRRLSKENLQGIEGVRGAEGKRGFGVCAEEAQVD